MRKPIWANGTKHAEISWSPHTFSLMDLWNIFAYLEFSQLYDKNVA